MSISQAEISRVERLRSKLFPFARFPRLGWSLDGSGFYATTLRSYAIRFSRRSRAFHSPTENGVLLCTPWAAFTMINSNGIKYHPFAIDFGGGADYKFPFRNFSWRRAGRLLVRHYAERLPE